MQNITLDTILVPVDFSDNSLNALDTAIAIAKRQKARLLLLHVFSTNPSIIYPQLGLATDFVYAKFSEFPEKELQMRAEKIKEEHAVECRAFVVTGAICPVITEQASTLKADLIVMGTHGVSGFREFFMGSCAYAVLKNAPCPVLTIPAHHKWEHFKKILFPVRAMANAIEKYQVARSIIRKNKAELIVMGLVEIDSPTTFDSLNENAIKLVEILKEDKVKLDTKFHYCDSFAQKILGKAKALKVDLVIVTANLDYKIQDFFIGPFAQQIVNHSKVPVLSIRPAPQKAS
jgi:nucleotide-binding universal stress UspA family protein